MPHLQCGLSLWLHWDTGNGLNIDISTKLWVEIECSFQTHRHSLSTEKEPNTDERFLAIFKKMAL